VNTGKMVCAFLLMTMVTMVVVPCALARQTLQILVHEGGDYLERTMRFWEAFERANPDIAVEVVPGPGSGSSPEEKLAVMVAAGIPPDLVRLWGVKLVAAAGLLEDITPRFQTLPASVRNDIWPVLFDDITYEDRLYALPLGTVVSMYYYNKQQFAERGIVPPDSSWSWEKQGVVELKKLSMDLDGDGILDRWGLGFVDGGAGREVYPFFYSAGGGSLFNQDGTRFLANTTVMRDALQYLQDLAQVHQIMRLGGDWKNFAEQRVASDLSGSFRPGYFAKYPNLDWDFALRPTFGGGRASNVWSETPYGISAGAKQPDLAWRALEFIVSVEGQELSIELGWAIPPVRRSVTLDAFLRYFKGKNVEAVAEMISLPLNQIIPTHVHPDVRAVLKNEVFYPVLYGQKAPGQALDEVTPKIEAMLRE
jgi:multiple sugar transport system substrate-binding protein